MRSESQVRSFLFVTKTLFPFALLLRLWIVEQLHQNSPTQYCNSEKDRGIKLSAIEESRTCGWVNKNRVQPEFTEAKLTVGLCLLFKRRA